MTIRGPIKTAWGADFTGNVTFRPYPHQLARVVGADVVGALPIVVPFSAGEPVGTLILTEGIYGVQFAGTSEFFIEVDETDDTASIATLVTSGVAVGGIVNSTASKLRLSYGDDSWELRIVEIVDGFPVTQWVKQ